MGGTHESGGQTISEMLNSFRDKVLTDDTVRGGGSTSIGMSPNLSTFYNNLMYGAYQYWDAQRGVFKDVPVNPQAKSILSEIGIIQDKTPFTINAPALTKTENYGKRVTGGKLYPGSSHRVDPVGITNLISTALSSSKSIIDKTLVDVDMSQGPDAEQVRKLMSKVGHDTLNMFTNNADFNTSLTNYYKKVAEDVATHIDGVKPTNISNYSGVATNSISTFFSSGVIEAFIDKILTINPKTNTVAFTITELKSWLVELPTIIDSLSTDILTKSVDVLKEDFIADAVTEYETRILERYEASKGKLNASLVAQNAANATALMFAQRLVERDKQLDVSKFETELKLKTYELFVTTQAQILANYNASFVPMFQSSLSADTQMSMLVANVFDAFIRVMLANADYIQAQINSNLNATASVYAGYNQIAGNYFSTQKNSENQLLHEIVNYVFNNKDKNDDLLMNYYKDVLNQHYLQTYSLYSDFYTKAQQVELLDYNWKLDTLTKGVGLVAGMAGATSNTMDAMPAWAMALQGIGSGLSAIGNVVSVIPFAG